MLAEEILPLLRLSGNSRSELDGKDDEDYPENDGIGTDQSDQTQGYNTWSYDQGCTQEHGVDSSQCQRPLLSNRQPYKAAAISITPVTIAHAAMR
jgi:hypothetical protein